MQDVLPIAKEMLTRDTSLNRENELFLRMELWWIEHISMKITYLRAHEQHKLYLLLKTKVMAHC